MGLLFVSWAVTSALGMNSFVCVCVYMCPIYEKKKNTAQCEQINQVYGTTAHSLADNQVFIRSQ